MKFKTKGIVFNYIKFRETSIIARIYTDQFGLKNYIINSVRTSKPRYPISYFQPLSQLEMVVYNKRDADINRIVELQSFNTYQSIPYQIVKSSVALFITEILFKTLKEEEENRHLYDFFEQSFQYYDLSKNHYVNFHLQFLFKYAKYLGFEPVKIANMLHEIEAGGFAISLPKEDQTLVDLFIESNYEKPVDITNELRRKLLNILILFYQVHFDNLSEIKSHKVLMEVFG